MFESVPEHSLLRGLRPTLRYWMETEVHVYGFAVAASVLLSFVPFLIVILSLCRHVLKWRAAVAAIHLALADYFPGPLADFVRRNVDVAVERGPFQVTSLVLLLLVANGIFEPLEVALNRAWGVPKHRSYWRNQLISLGLIFTCGVLAMASTSARSARVRKSSSKSRFVAIKSARIPPTPAMPASANKAAERTSDCT